jgi:hypothetical protein
MKKANIFSLSPWQSGGLVGLSLAVGLTATFTRVYLGERQAVEWLVAMDAGGYETAISIFDGERTKNMHVDASSLFSQFVFEFGKYQGTLKPKGVNAKVRLDKNIPELATLSISGRADTATPEVMSEIAATVKDRITARTRDALAQSQAQSSAQVEASLSALAAFPHGPRSMRLTRKAVTPEAEPHAPDPSSDAAPEPQASVPEMVVYGADPIAEQLGLLLVTKRMMERFDAQKLEIPIFTVSEERTISSPFNLPAWLLGTLATVFTAILSYGLAVAWRHTDTGNKVSLPQPFAKGAGTTPTTLRAA